MIENVTTVRRTGRLSAPGAIFLVLATVLVAPTDASAADEKVQAKIVKVTWQEPGEAHTIAPHGTITIVRYPHRIITKLPPGEDLKDDLTMTFVVELDVTKSTKAPFRFKQRSGILTITPSPEDIQDDVVQPSAIDDTTATVRIDVTAHGVRLTSLKPVYFEQVNVWLAGKKKRGRRMEWVWKPFGKHDL